MPSFFLLVELTLGAQPVSSTLKMILLFFSERIQPSTDLAELDRTIVLENGLETFEVPTTKQKLK